MMDFVNINEFNDVELTSRMRTCNYEKYKSLVRMHLSFELDLNTDEFDLPCHEIIYEEKGKLKKWNRLSKKHKHNTCSGSTTGCAVTSGAKSAGSSPTECLQQQIDAGFLMHLQELKEFLLLDKNITQEGLFRKAGSVSRQNELRLHIQQDKPLDLDEAGYTAHDCATVFKSFLAELPEPLLTDAHYPAHLQIVPLCQSVGNVGIPSDCAATTADRQQREQHLLHSVQLLLLLLPEENRELLQHIIEMLHAIALQEIHNKMSAENLATLFAPHLICPRNLPPEVLHYTAKKMSSIIAYMIVRGMVIFEVPGKLATDVRAYFLERKRKKTMSPEQTLDESISDISTVNTVYTFVDRAATAAATNTNTTDTELAQLYAHIQSLPESSKKRRLIKQFNKQNGQGTPLQLVVMNRLKNNEATRGAKSLGDSIKKHIFHKSLMSRTPKRSAVMTPIGIETPNFSNTKQPKLRVLFQSPTPSVANATPTTGGTLKRNTTNVSTTSSTTITTSMHKNTNLQQTTPRMLKKSISSSSLLKLDSGANVAAKTCNVGGSISAPVSRQHSHDMTDGIRNVTVSAIATATATTAANASVSLSATNNDVNSAIELQDLDSNCCVTPLKIMSAAAKQLINGAGDKKSVAWDEHHLLAIEEYSNPCTPIQQCGSDLKSRYKSEPNLSRTGVPAASVCGAEAPELTPITKSSSTMASKSLTRKLMKGVSMGNLRFPFSTPETTKRLVRSVSATLRRRASDEVTHAHGAMSQLAHCFDAPLLEDVDDSDLDDDEMITDAVIHSDDEDIHEHANIEDDTLSGDVSLLTGGTGSNSSSSIALGGKSGSSYKQLLHNTSTYRNTDLITSTPSLMLGRRSMSPITKSTQRMPKAMQESIMTPRSRKPVMVLTAANSDPNQINAQSELARFREQDEDDSLVAGGKQIEPPALHSEDATSLGGYAEILKRQHLQQANHSFLPQTLTSLGSSDSNSSSSHSSSSNNTGSERSVHNALSTDFKEYLLTRSVLTASPVDSSFASQPDDFGGITESTQDIEELNESQLSPSLLYCLDGNEPNETDTTEVLCCQQDVPQRTAIALNTAVLVNNARKRAASSDIDKTLLHGTTSTNNITAKVTNIIEANKENYAHADSYKMTKKLLISEFPDETAL